MKEQEKKHIWSWTDKLNEQINEQTEEVVSCEGKVAVIGDIHSNLEALTEVLEDARSQGVDKFVCTGDVVGYASNPKECIKIIQDLGCPCVMGNHDQYVGVDCNISNFNLNAMNAVLWTRENLNRDEREWLKSLPLVFDNDVLKDNLGFDDFGIVHSNLVEPEKWVYVLESLSFKKVIVNQKMDLVFFGHTHVPSMYGFNEETKAFSSAIPMEEGIYFLDPGLKWLVNPGSVGQPRDSDSRASYAIYDSSKKEVEIRRVVYDVTKASKKIEKAGLPLENGERLFKGD